MKRAGMGIVLIGCVGVASGQVDVSHDVGTVGAPGSAINAGPNAGEIFSTGGGSNVRTATLASLGLLPGDNLDAFDRGDVWITTNGVSRFPLLFSVEAGSVGQMPYPAWMQVPFNGADVYAIESGKTGHLLAYNEPGLGFLTAPAESIDAMTDSMVTPGQRVYFSLQQGSPTLLANAWSGADVLSVVIGAPASLRRAMRANDLGLIPADELDALAIFGMQDGGDGVVDPVPSEGAMVYFSVDETSVGAIGTEVRQRSLTSLHHGGDVYLSGVVGANTLLYESDLQIRLGAGDVLDALKLGSGDPADPFPMYGPGGITLLDIPRKPNACPPYRGGGAPIGGGWVEVCDSPVPTIVNWQLELKMCDANGNVMSIVKNGRIRGAATPDPNIKAQLIKDVFDSMRFPKPGQTPNAIPVFSKVQKNVPPVNVPRPGITGEVCFAVSQDVIDCGWNIDQICFSFSNWTANIIPIPVLGWFPDVERRPMMRVDGIAKIDGLLRVSSTDTLGPGGVDQSFVVPIAAGQDGGSAVLELADQINSMGGFALVDSDFQMSIRDLPLEPPTNSEGVSGPAVYEGGAPGVDGVRVTMGAALARGPGSPCNAVDYAKPYGVLDFFDISAFLQKFSDQAGDADLAYDGKFDFFDISLFLQLYSQGCPDLDG
ncbi:MAG: hypothetical protein JJ974_11670 [Phycisphaerales bacterium]|nr:hypothetical protein [Phycisphaerales bacterium]